MGPRVYAELATKGIIGQSVMRQVARHNSRPTARTAGPLAVKVVRLLKAWDREETSKILKERRRKEMISRGHIRTGPLPPREVGNINLYGHLAR